MPPRTKVKIGSWARFHRPAALGASPKSHPDATRNTVCVGGTLLVLHTDGLFGAFCGVAAPSQRFRGALFFRVAFEGIAGGGGVGAVVVRLVLHAFLRNRGGNGR